MVSTPDGWVIPTTLKMPFPMDGFGDRKGDSKKTVRWSPYMVELDISNLSTLKLMPTEGGSVGKEDRCTLPIRNLVLDGTGSSCGIPAVLSYVSSNGNKKDGKPWDGDAYLYPVIISGTYGTSMAYSL